MSKELSPEELNENYVKGLERTLGDLGPKLRDQVDGLTTKQLRRSLKAAINYIYKKEDNTDASALKDEEKRFIGETIALIETGIAYSVNVIADLQKQRQEKESE